MELTNATITRSSQRDGGHIGAKYLLIVL